MNIHGTSNTGSNSDTVAILTRNSTNAIEFSCNDCSIRPVLVENLLLLLEDYRDASGRDFIITIPLFIPS